VNYRIWLCAVDDSTINVILVLSFLASYLDQSFFVNKFLYQLFVFVSLGLLSLLFSFLQLVCWSWGYF